MSRWQRSVSFYVRLLEVWENIMEPLKIGLRSQDIQTSTQDIDLGPLGAETKNVRLLGMAERLAIHIRGSDVIKDYKRLEYISSQLGIDPLMLPKVLQVLQDLGWTRVKSSGDQIVKVEETVPYFSDIYTSAGEYFSDQNPSEIETGIIAVCDTLASCPRPEEHVLESLGLDQKALAMILDIGRSGGIINQYTSSTGEKIIYSPVFWAENPDKLEDIYSIWKNYGAEQVCNALDTIRAYQGYPLDSNVLRGRSRATEQEEIVAEVIRRGMVLAPKVDSKAGPKNFAFTPQAGISLQEKVILEKAMALLACVRYGQHFGFITKIKYPELILERLLQPPHRIGPHTEVLSQYSILIGRGMGKILRSRMWPSRYYFKMFTTEENIKAVKLAKDLLSFGEILEDRGLSKELKSVLFYRGSYEEAIRTLPSIKKQAQFSRVTRNTVFNIVNDAMDLLRGADQ